MNFTVYFISFVIFIALDLLWLGVLAKDFYQTKLGYLLGPVNWYAAIIFYLIFICGITFFVTMPALQNGSVMQAVLIGALFGFITYGTYDLTNQATIKDWPVLVTIVDMIWGAVLGATVSGATVAISKMFL